MDMLLAARNCPLRLGIRPPVQISIPFPLLSLPRPCLERVFCLGSTAPQLLLHGSEFASVSVTSNRLFREVCCSIISQISHEELGLVLGIAETDADMFMLAVWNLMTLQRKVTRAVANKSSEVPINLLRDLRKELGICLEELGLDAKAVQDGVEEADGPVGHGDGSDDADEDSDQESDSEPLPLQELKDILFAVKHCQMHLLCKPLRGPRCTDRFTWSTLRGLRRTDRFTWSTLQMKQKVQHLAHQVQIILEQRTLTATALAFVALAVQHGGGRSTDSAMDILKRFDDGQPRPFYRRLKCGGALVLSLRHDVDADQAIFCEVDVDLVEGADERIEMHAGWSQQAALDLQRQNFISGILGQWKSPPARHSPTDSAIADALRAIPGHSIISAFYERNKLKDLDIAVRPATFVEAFRSLAAVEPAIVLHQNPSTEPGRGVVSATLDAVNTLQDIDATSNLVIQDVAHAEPAALLDAECLLVQAEADWVENAERNIQATAAEASECASSKVLATGGVESGLYDVMEKVHLLRYGTCDAERFRSVLLSGPELKPCREGLEAAGFAVELPSNAKIFVRPEQYSMVKHALVGMELHPFHVIVAEGFEQSLTDALATSPYKKRPRERPNGLGRRQLHLAARSGDSAAADGNGNHVRSGEQPEEEERLDAVICVSRTFLCVVHPLKDAQSVVQSTTEAHHDRFCGLNPRRVM